jgi:hypothetical protein
MAQHLALVENETSPDEAVYDALLAALSSTARGRAFLEEHARRVRADDTAAALAALARIEAMLVKQQSAAVHPPLKGEGRRASRNDAEPGWVESQSEMSHPTRTAVAALTRSTLPLQGRVDPGTVREELLAQVMALSPEERIALFS